MTSRCVAALAGAAIAAATASAARPPHAIPHRRRRPHSNASSAASAMNTIGMSHRSRRSSSVEPSRLNARSSTTRARAVGVVVAAAGLARQPLERRRGAAARRRARSRARRPGPTRCPRRATAIAGAGLDAHTVEALLVGREPADVLAVLLHRPVERHRDGLCRSGVSTVAVTFALLTGRNPWS